MWPEDDPPEPASVEESLGARRRQEFSPLEAQDKVSLLGVCSFAKANKTLVLTLLSWFYFSGNVLLCQAVRERKPPKTWFAIGHSSNFFSFLKDVCVRSSQLRTDCWTLLKI